MRNYIQKSKQKVIIEVDNPKIPGKKSSGDQCDFRDINIFCFKSFENSFNDPNEQNCKICNSENLTLIF